MTTITIGDIVRIRPNRVHPRLAGTRATVVDITAPDRGSCLRRRKLSGAPCGGNPIVEIAGRRFLFRAGDLSREMAS